MKTLSIIVAVIFLVLILASMSVAIFYAISVFKQRSQQKEEFDQAKKQTKDRIAEYNQRPKRRPLSTSSLSVSSSGLSSSNNQYLHDPMIAVAIASSDIGPSSSYSSGGYSGGSSCSGSSDSSSSSSSDSSSSSCD